MRYSKYILNSQSATLAEVGAEEVSLTIPANFTADGVRESVIYHRTRNALFRFRITGGVDSPSIDADTAIQRTYNGLGILYYVTVYRKDENHVALACMTTDGRAVTGTSATTLRAKIHFYESPFEA